MFFSDKRSELAISATEEVSFDVILHIPDYDGCLSHSDVIHSPCKNIVLKNQGLFEQLKTKYKLKSQESLRFVGSGSARQSFAHDIFAAKEMNNGLSFLDIQQVADEMKALSAPILLSDIFGDLSKGTSLLRSLNRDYKEEHAACISDASKLTLLHAHIHSIAEDNPNKQICIDFSDDKERILRGLISFYTKYPQMIPSNVTLDFSQYKGAEHSTWQRIKGTGTLDVHYRQTVIDMIAITTMDNNKQQQHCAEYVTPEKLSTYRDELIKTAPDNSEVNHLRTQEKHTVLYTHKPTHLQLKLTELLDTSKKTIDKVVIPSWTTELQTSYAEKFLTLFIYSMSKNYFCGMQLLGYLDETSLYAVDSLGLTLLHRAVFHRSATAVDYLAEKFIKNGNSLDSLTPPELNTPIGPAVSATNKTALGLAVHRKYDEIAMILFEKGAKPPAPKAHENHMIHVLSRRNKLHEIQELLKNNPELAHLPDTNGHTILFYAKQFCDSPLSKWLTEYIDSHQNNVMQSKTIFNL